MSIRYGILVVPEPSFTARAYRARQIICGQYGSWAAEMHMLHIPVIDYFQCPEDAMESVAAGLGRVARGTTRRLSGIPLGNRGVATSSDFAGHIFLDFQVSEDQGPRRPGNLNALRHDVIEMLQQVYGVDPNRELGGEGYRPHLPLMQYASLPVSVFDSAVEFARGVVRALEVPDATRAWRLLLVRFQSSAADAAPDGWAQGLWAADLRWEVLASHPL